LQTSNSTLSTALSNLTHLLPLLLLRCWPSLPQAVSAGALKHSSSAPWLQNQSRKWENFVSFFFN
jgi:hypothetical protein